MVVLAGFRALTVVRLIIVLAHGRASHNRARKLHTFETHGRASFNRAS